MQRNCFLKQKLAKKYLMKILKKIVLTFLVIVVLAVFGGYIYFDQKFTQEKII